jgi:hypothetical protein
MFEIAIFNGRRTWKLNKSWAKEIVKVVKDIRFPFSFPHFPRLPDLVTENESIRWALRVPPTRQVSAEKQLNSTALGTKNTPKVVGKWILNIFICNAHLQTYPFHPSTIGNTISFGHGLVVLFSFSHSFLASLLVTISLAGQVVLFIVQIHP